MKQKNRTQPKISTSKKIVFNAIFIVFALIVLGLVEFGLRMFDYGADMSLFIESEKYPGYYEINKDVNLRYFSKTINTKPGNDIFLKNKTDNTCRIFVFGGSTAKGYPYQINNSFSRILHFRLNDAFPHKNIEVVNLSASAINSFTYVDIIDEVLEYKPDLILLYGGHNEYYGAMGAASNESFGNSQFVKRLRLKVSKLKLFQLIQNTTRKVQYALSNTNDDATQTLMQRIVKDTDIVYKSDKYEQGLKQFESNIHYFVKKAVKNDVPVVLSELVSNVRDQKPFQSIKNTNYPTADSIYRKAQSFDREGDYSKANTSYVYAKDLDAIRFRAPEDFNKILHVVAQKYEVPVVPMIEYFENESKNTIIGNDLMIDHLHPNIDGYFVMADAFFATLKANQFIEKQWDETRIKPSAYYRNTWGFTALDSLVANLNVQSLKAGWPFKPEGTVNLFIESYEPESYLDSIAYRYVSKGDIYVEDEHIKLAKMYASVKQYQKAFNEYLAVVRLHPYLPNLYYDAAKYLIYQKKYEQAHAFLHSAPGFAKGSEFYYMSGILNLDLDNEEQGIVELRKALELNDSSFDKILAYRPLEYAYTRNGDSLALEQLKEEYPQLAFQSSNAGKTQKIEQKLTPDQSVQLAEKYLENKEIDKAKELLLLVTQKHKTFVALKLLGKVHYIEKDYTNAYRVLAQAYNFNDTDVELLVHYYLLCNRFNNTDEAKLILEKLRELNFDDEKIEKLKQVSL